MASNERRPFRGTSDQAGSPPGANCDAFSLGRVSTDTDLAAQASTGFLTGEVCFRFTFDGNDGYAFTIRSNRCEAHVGPLALRNKRACFDYCLEQPLS